MELYGKIKLDLMFLSIGLVSLNLVRKLCLVILVKQLRGKKVLYISGNKLLMFRASEKLMM